MNIKTLILLCVIVLFVPACIVADSQYASQQQHLAFNLQQEDLREYRQLLQNKFEVISKHKEQLEQELLKLTAMEDKYYATYNVKKNPFKKTEEQQPMSELFGFSKCNACKAGATKIVKTFGCGSFLISYKSCLPLVTSLVGAAVCGATIFAAKKTIVKACEKYSDINKVASAVTRYVCHDKLHWC